MIDRLPRRLRLGFSKSADPVPETGRQADVVFVAYAEDCIVTGRTVLDAGRLTDMLNAHDEYVLLGVTVERFVGDEPLEVAEIVVPRDEIFLVQASGPRGEEARRHRTMPHRMVVKMGPYEVYGDFHALPGADPADAFHRRKAMVPLTDARIEFTIGGQRRVTLVETVIVNREQIDWVGAVAASQVGLPETKNQLVARPARPAPANA
jgi:hypothetical protein